MNTKRKFKRLYLLLLIPLFLLNPVYFPSESYAGCSLNNEDPIYYVIRDIRGESALSLPGYMNVIKQNPPKDHLTSSCNIPTSSGKCMNLYGLVVTSYGIMSIPTGDINNNQIIYQDHVLQYYVQTEAHCADGDDACIDENNNSSNIYYFTTEAETEDAGNQYIMVGSQCHIDVTGDITPPMPGDGVWWDAWKWFNENEYPDNENDYRIHFDLEARGVADCIYELFTDYGCDPYDLD